MQNWHGMARLLGCWLAAGCLAFYGFPIFGADRCREFLDGLRDPRREMYDLALEYLEDMRTSPMADRDFQETIDFEVGVTLMQGTRSLPPKEHEKRLEQALGYFRKFRLDHFKHPLITTTNRYLADILIEQAEIKTEYARQPDTLPKDRKRLLGEARALLMEAEQALNVIDESLSKRLKSFRVVDKNDKRRLAERDQVRSDAILTRLALARIVYDKAQLEEPGSKAWKDMLAAAAAQYSRHYWLYKDWLGGIAFRIEEARCHKELGNYTKALSILEELAAPLASDDERARQIRTTATLMALQINVLPSMKKYQDAWTLFENWEMNSERPGESSDLVPAIKYFGGAAALEHARGLDSTDPNERWWRRERLQQAKRLLTEAASVPGPLQLRAKMKLNDPLLTVGELFGDEPKSYAEARDLARVAWGQLQQPKLKSQQAGLIRSQGLLYFQYALKHAPRDAPIDELCQLRSCLAHLSLLSGDCHDAAVLGEFLMRRYPDRPETSSAAYIAMLAWRELSGKAGSGDDRRFESDRMASIAQLITERWPYTPAADEAWITLAQAAANVRDVDRMIECLGRVSDESPRRGNAELMAGKSLWRACVEASKLPEDQQPTRVKLKNMTSQARMLLETGIGRLRKPMDAGAPASPELADASLILAQVCLDMGDGAAAAASLDDPKLGAHTLVAAGSPAVNRAGFAVETLKTALRAYVATQQWEKANETLCALEQIAGSHAKLTHIYLSLGQQIEDSLKRIRVEGNAEQASEAARGFDFFLSRIADQPADKTTYVSLYWVAETFRKLGASLDPGDGDPTDEAVEYYEKAVKTYQKILDACRANPQYAPRSNAAAAVRIQMSRCLRRLGKFEEAVQALVDVLKARETTVDAQREAALTYQIWGEKKPAYFLKAIDGGHPLTPSGSKPHNVIWGWGGLARKVQSIKKFQDTFHDARYNLAICRLKYALSRPEAEKTKLLKQAEHDILVVQRLRPDMGGKKWYNQYDDLLRTIQRHLGVKVNKRGLKAAERRMSAAAQ